MALKQDHNKAFVFPTVRRHDPETAEAVLNLIPQGGVDWASALRTQGLARLREYGLPTPRLERWKFTHIMPVIKGMDLSYGSETMLVDGAHTRSLDKNVLDWLSVEPPTGDKSYDMMLWDLNNACLDDGIVIDVPDNVVVEQPIRITVTGKDGCFANQRIMIRLGRNAQATVICEYGGQGCYWNNSVIQIMLGDNASLKHYRMQDESDEALHTTTGLIETGRDARYQAYSFNGGATMMRHQMHVVMKAQGGECHFNGVLLGMDKQHQDTTLLVEHQAPHCVSSQTYQAALAGQSRGVFQGKVHVHRGADKTDGSQLCHALLLSDRAEMDTKPELEIYADDVQCAHGATTGKLEDDPLFYMRARGIPEKTARMMLVEAFLSAEMHHIDDEGFRDLCLNKVQNWLEKAV